MALHGIDVSSNNAHPISWKASVSAGERFVFVKLTERSLHGEYVNPYKNEDISGPKAVGMDVGGYTFIHPGVTAKETVDFALANSAGVWKIAVDSESTDGLTWKQIADNTHECLELLADRALLYSNPYFLSNMPGAPWGFPLWLAEYGVHEPTHPCLFWQYSGGLHVPGINGLTDANLYYGTQDQLHSFFLPPKH